MRGLRLFFLLSLFLATGCGPATRTVTGEVTIDGEPLDNASITFIPTEAGGAAKTASITGGTFKLEVTVGKHRVEILAAPRVVAQPAASGRPIVTSVTPARYNTESTLTADVQSAGPNQFKFPLLAAP